MQTDTGSFDFESLPVKLVAAAIVVACLALGVIGLVLPLIPGLLFIAIAAVVAAKVSPRFAEILRGNATLRGYLDRTDGFMALPLGQKIQLACLLGVKMIIDGVALLVAGVMRLVRAAERA
jgi:uncharacterized membrane protein YbaN (DUF454 family)